MQPVNTIQLLINAVLTLLLPILIGCACWIYRLFVQRLPELSAVRLEQFARMAVQSTEQKYQGNSSKRSLAEVAMINLYKSHKLPIPGKDDIDTAIESAVFELHKQV